MGNAANRKRSNAWADTAECFLIMKITKTNETRARTLIDSPRDAPQGLVTNCQLPGQRLWALVGGQLLTSWYPRATPPKAPTPWGNKRMHCQGPISSSPASRPASCVQRPVMFILAIRDVNWTQVALAQLKAEGLHRSLSRCSALRKTRQANENVCGLCFHYTAVAPCARSWRYKSAESGARFSRVTSPLSRLMRTQGAEKRGGERAPQRERKRCPNTQDIQTLK